MNNSVSPVLFASALFWGGLVAIVFSILKIRRRKKDKSAYSEAISYQNLEWHPVANLYFHPKAPRRDLENKAKLHQTLPLPEECVGFLRILLHTTYRNTARKATRCKPNEIWTNP
jgi:hypothetical protein